MWHNLLLKLKYLELVFHVVSDICQLLYCFLLNFKIPLITSVSSLCLSGVPWCNHLKTIYYVLFSCSIRWVSLILTQIWWTVNVVMDDNGLICYHFQVIFFCFKSSITHPVQSKKSYICTSIVLGWWGDNFGCERDISRLPHL